MIVKVAIIIKKGRNVYVRIKILSVLIVTGRDIIGVDMIIIYLRIHPIMHIQ